MRELMQWAVSSPIRFFMFVIALAVLVGGGWGAATL